MIEEISIPKAMVYSRVHDAVFKLVGKYLNKPSNVLDLAAGQGAFSVRLKELGHKVLAVDGDKEHWNLTDFEYLELNLDCEFAGKINRKFDAIVAIEIIEHIENPFSFVRECAKLLNPGGFLFLTTPNVEAVNSRLLFLFKGRLHLFDEWTTVRTAHITPIFKWKLDMCLDEAGFKILDISSGKQVFDLDTNLKGKIIGVAARIIRPFLKGNKDGEGWIIAAELVEK
jgi:2-polyprenyl-3-methyl-5-hydroxy-6-metoxy-1,4-benzoquinol methylase